MGYSRVHRAVWDAGGCTGELRGCTETCMVLGCLGKGMGCSRVHRAARGAQGKGWGAVGCTEQYGMLGGVQGS